MPLPSHFFPHGPPLSFLHSQSIITPSGVGQCTTPAGLAAVNAVFCPTGAVVGGTCGLEDPQPLVIESRDQVCMGVCAGTWGGVVCEVCVWGCGVVLFVWSLLLPVYTFCICNALYFLLLPCLTHRKSTYIGHATYTHTYTPILLHIHPLSHPPTHVHPLTNIHTHTPNYIVVTCARLCPPVTRK